MSNAIQANEKQDSETVVEAVPSRMVRLNVRGWFDDPEFQKWFNSRLGKGLASWQPTSEPLTISVIDQSEHESLAEILLLTVINADVLFDPVNCGDDEMFRSEVNRVQKAQKTLDSIYHELSSAGEGVIGSGSCSEMAEALVENVINADVFFEPCGEVASSEQEQSEYDRLKAAQSTLDDLYKRFTEVSESANHCGYSDVFVGVDPSFNGEGTDSDMPERFWDVVVEEARKAAVGSRPECHVVVWLASV